MHAHCAQLAGKKYIGYGDWGMLTSNGIDVVDARLAVLEGRHRACPPSAQLESCIAKYVWGSDTLAPDAEPPGGSVRVEIAYVLVPDAAFAPGFCGGVLHDAQAGAALAPADRASLLARACREAWGDAAPAVPAPEAEADAEAEAARREVFDPGPSAALRVGEGQEGYVALGTLAALLTTALAPRGTPARCLVWGGLAVVARELAAESALMLPSLRARLPWTYWHAARVRRGAREEGLLLGRAHEALTHADAAADALGSQAWRACTARLEAAEAISLQGSAAFASL